MRIAYLIHSLHRGGGMERVLGLKAGLLASRHEVFIVTSSQKGRPDAFPVDSRVKRIDLGKSERFFKKAYRKSLEKCLCEIKPDITISLCGPEIFLLPRLKDGSRKIAEFHFTHHKYYLKYGRNPVSALRTRRMEKAAAALDSFVVLTKSDAIHWPVKCIQQIYNPLSISTNEISDLSSKRAIAIGRLMPQKNFADAIEAWELVSHQHPDWTLDIFGEGRQRHRLEKMISARGLEGKVCLKGNSTNIRKELLSSSFILMSSRYEGFPMVLLEAAACGVPMVSYNCPSGPSEIITDGENGFLVPCGDVNALAGACRQMISSNRTAMGAAAHQTAESFSPEVIMAQWEKLFQSLADNHTPTFQAD